MRRRLYFMLPDLDSAKRTADDLLLARVDDRQMHFLARRGTELGELNEATYLHKSDLLHGARLGLAVGGAGGLLLGAAILAFPPAGNPQMVTVLVTTVVGAVLGAWMSSMAAAAVPNSRLKQFEEQIGAGKILLILDVPYAEVDRVRELVMARHPEAVSGGQETRFPAFP